MDSADFPLFSRNEPLHLFLDVLSVNDEEDELLSSIPRIRRKNVSLVQCQSNSFRPWERFLVKSQQVLFFVVLLLPLIGSQNLVHPVVTLDLRADLQEFLCRFNFITNLFDPWKILTQEWVSSLLEDIIRISTPCLPCNWLQLPTRVQFRCFLGSILSVVMLLPLLEEFIHDKPLYWIVKSPVSFVMKHCPFSITLRIPASIQNLLNSSCCGSFSIRFSYFWNGKFWYAGSSLSNETSALSTIDCPITTERAFLSWRDSYSSHISATVP